MPFFNVLTSKSGPRLWCFSHCKCASRHSGVRFLDIGTSKIGPAMRFFAHFDLQWCFAPQRHAIFGHRNFQNWSRNEVFLHILTYKCAARHSGVRFLDIETSKIGPAMRFFAHFDLQWCFAPQRRAIFGHRNFQNWSRNEVFLTF